MAGEDLVKPSRRPMATSNADEVLETFNRIGLFGTAGDKSLADRVTELTLKKGDIVVRENETTSEMFIVKEGSCDVYKQVGDSEIYILSLNRNEFGGLGSMIDQKPHSASVKAAEDGTVIYKLSHKAFKEALQELPELLDAVLKFMSRQLKLERNLLPNYRQTVAGDSADRVLMFDAKPYEKKVFEEELQRGDYGFEFQYQELRLGPSTAHLAAGYKAICIFVNDTCDAKVVLELQRVGVEMILLRCAGFDRVDLKACDAMGITVARVPAYSPYAVAEHALTLLMTLNRRLHLAYDRVRNQNFSLNGLVGMDIHGKKVGVIGTGKIGQCFIDIMLGMGCTVLAYDVYKASKYDNVPQVKYVDLETVCQESDVISLHCPLLDSTKHIINANTLGLMKKHVILINTSRGGLVDTKALVHALKQNQIGGAGLDVYEQEQDYFFQDKSGENISDDILARLLTFRNVVVTSHQAFLTQDALQNIASCTLNNFKSFLGGNELSACSNSLNTPPEKEAKKQ